MNGTLFRKELRSLRPFVVVVLALVLLDIVDNLLTPFGARTFPDRLQSLSTELALMQIVLGFSLGVNLLVREIDDGTLNFLDGLPLKRGTIFAAKIQAAILVLFIYDARLARSPIAALLAADDVRSVRPRHGGRADGRHAAGLPALFVVAGTRAGRARDQAAAGHAAVGGGGPEHGRPADLAFYRDRLATADGDHLDPAGRGAAVRFDGFRFIP
jgi:hypothetical protein